MKCETVRKMLDDYADGLLIGDEPGQVERHLQSCPECARAAAALDALLREAKNLPRVIEPRRDLWAGIRAEIENRSQPNVSAKWRVARLGLAAAILAVLAGGLLLLGRGRPIDRDAVTTEGPFRLQQEVVAVEAEYQRARQEIVTAMEKAPNRLAPETRAVISQNLAIIDGAMKEIRESLEKDPENVFLFEMLVAEQDRSLQLLSLEEAIISNTW